MPLAEGLSFVRARNRIRGVLAADDVAPHIGTSSLMAASIGARPNTGLIPCAPQLQINAAGPRSRCKSGTVPLR